MASLDSKSEEFPNLEETQIRKGENELIHSRPLTFKLADKHSGCYGNGLIDVAEKFEFGACSL